MVRGERRCWRRPWSGFSVLSFFVGSAIVYGEVGSMRQSMPPKASSLSADDRLLFGKIPRFDKRETWGIFILHSSEGGNQTASGTSAEEATYLPADRR